MIKYLVIAAAAAALAPALPAAADIVPHTATSFHNEARAFHGVGPIVWDPALREGARAWAAACRFLPSARDAGYGENLYVTTSWADDASVLRDAVVAWANETVLKFNPAKHRYATDVSHFTQIVGTKTSGVAVAIADCPAGAIFGQPTKFVVARYSH